MQPGSAAVDRIGAGRHERVAEGGRNAAGLVLQHQLPAGRHGGGRRQGDGADRGELRGQAEIAVVHARRIVGIADRRAEIDERRQVQIVEAHLLVARKGGIPHRDEIAARRRDRGVLDKVDIVEPDRPDRVRLVDRDAGPGEDVRRKEHIDRDRDRRRA
jgi:hypothetical protein